jgi:hypothetical protein
MQRLISLFQQPREPYESPPGGWSQGKPLFPGEPEYFEQLMQYLRQRNREAAIWNAAREGAD